MRRLPPMAVALLLLSGITLTAFDSRSHRGGALGSVTVDGKYDVIVVEGYGRAIRINNRRQVLFQGSGLSGALWEDGVLTPISSPRDLNERGQVVGLDSQGGFLWDDGVITQLVPPGHNSSYTQAINNAGDVLVTAHMPEGVGGPPRSYVWSHGRYQQLPVWLDGWAGLNNRGEAFGFVFSGFLNGSRIHGSVIVDTHSGAIRYFPFNSEPTVKQLYDMNDRGDVVGVMGLPPCGAVGSLTAVAMRLTGDEPESLGVLNPPCNVGTYAWTINNRGQIAGQAGSAAFLWEDGETTWLPGPNGWSPVDINDRGDVVGSYYDVAHDQQIAVLLFRRR
jgi:uncharacterized membrane protein